MGLLSGPLTLPAFAVAPANALLRRLLAPDDSPPVDFAQPPGEPALMAADSVSWRIFRNPVTVFIGGVAAVVLELAEPRVRSGVWDHSSFRRDPGRRMSRTGLAAMMTVYGPAGAARNMIAGVTRMHGRVTGVTPDGEAYAASDPDLLDWVQGTASFGFIQAYHVYAGPLSRPHRDRAYAEGAEAAALYGARGAPRSEADMEALFARFADRLAASAILFEFLDVMRSAVILPAQLRPLQPLMVKGALGLVPGWARPCLQLREADLPTATDMRLLRTLAAVADRVVLTAHPAVQASRRLGLPDDYAYHQQG